MAKEKQPRNRSRVVIEQYEGPSVGTGKYSDRIAINPRAPGFNQRTTRKVSGRGKRRNGRRQA